MSSSTESLLAPEAPTPPPPVFKIESNNLEMFEMSGEAIEQSKTLHALVSTIGVGTGDETTIPVNNVDGVTLRLVVKWCEQHKGEPVPNDYDYENAPKSFVIPDWDKSFLKELDNDVLFDLICAANYLDIRGLMNSCCKKVAEMAKGKSPDELRVIFGIPTDEEDAIAELEAAREKAEKEKAEKKKKAEAAAAAADKKNDEIQPTTSTN